MGHFLNMVLKDVFVKIALLDGKYAKFVPGWDMHGLPIEYETLKFLGVKDFHTIDPLELRERCKERALFWLDRQREQRERMGCFGLFDHPYRTIDPSFEATIVNALADLAERQQIYKGLRSTLWCIHDETALAEAEIEYEQRVSPSVYVRFAATPEQAVPILAAFGPSTAALRAFAQDDTAVSFLIWTTTPWTLPANAAIALRGNATYGLYRVGDELLILAEALAPQALGERFAQATLLARARGDGSRRPRRAPPLHGSRLGHRAGRLRGSRDRDRCGAHRARPRCRRLRYRDEVRSSDPQSGRCRGALHRRGRTVRRDAHLQGQSANRRRPRAQRSPLERSRTTSIRIRTAGAARTRSSSARPRSGFSRWIKTCCGSVRSMRSRASSIRPSGDGRASAR